MPAVLAAFGKQEFSLGSGRIPGRGFISIILGTLSAFILTSILLQSRHLKVLYAFNATCLIFVSRAGSNLAGHENTSSGFSCPAKLDPALETKIKQVAGHENTSSGFSFVSSIHLASYEYIGIKPSGKSL